VYKPFIYDWYNNAYSQHRYVDTKREMMRPLKRDPAPDRYKPLKFESGLAPRSSWIPYYSNQTKRIYNDEVQTTRQWMINGGIRPRKLGIFVDFSSLFISISGHKGAS
jgi:hypothetical protein